MIPEVTGQDILYPANGHLVVIPVLSESEVENAVPAGGYLGFLLHQEIRPKLRCPCLLFWEHSQSQDPLAGSIYVLPTPFQMNKGQETEGQAGVLVTMTASKWNDGESRGQVEITKVLACWLLPLHHVVPVFTPTSTSSHRGQHWVSGMSWKVWINKGFW